MSSSSIFVQPQNYTYSDVNHYAEIPNLVSLNLYAYKDEAGAVKNLTLGASSNVVVEATNSVQIAVKDSGPVKILTTTVDPVTNARTDRDVLEIAQGASNMVMVKAGASQGLAFKSMDAGRTALLSGMALSNDRRYQHFITDSNLPVKLNAAGTLVQNLVSSASVFGSDLNVIRAIGGSNVGDVAECGFSFRINAQMQLELIKYSRVLDASGPLDVYARVATFGGIGGLDANTPNPTQGFTPYTTRDALVPSPWADWQPPSTNQQWAAGFEGMGPLLMTAAGDLFIGAVPDNWDYQGFPTALYNLNGAVSGVSVPNPAGTKRLLLAKYSAGGIAQWALTFGGNVDVQSARIIEDTSTGNIGVVVNCASVGALAGDGDYIALQAVHTSGTQTSVRVPFKSGGTGWTDAVIILSASGVPLSVVAVTNVANGFDNTRPAACYDQAGNLFLSGNRKKANIPATVSSDGSEAVTGADVTGDAALRSVIMYVARFPAPTSGPRTADWIVHNPLQRWVSGIAVDTTGALYVAGNYVPAAAGKVLTQADGSSTSVTLPQAFAVGADPSDVAAGLIKYSTSGTPQWAAAIDAQYEQDLDAALAVTPNDTIIVVSQVNSPPYGEVARFFNGNGVQNPLAIPEPQCPAGALFVAAYNTSGVGSWVTLIDYFNNDNRWVPTPSFNASGDILIGGGYYGGAAAFYDDMTNFGVASTTVTVPVNNNGGTFAVLLNKTTGRALWAEAVSGSRILDIRDVVASRTSNAYYMSVAISVWNGVVSDPLVLSSGASLVKPPTYRALIKSTITL